MSGSQAVRTQQQLKDALVERLADLGVRRRGIFLEMPLPSGFTGNFAFGYATWPGHPGWINVLPTIGVDEESLSRRVSELGNKPYVRGLGLWGYPVSALDPDVGSTWWLGPELDPASVDALAAMLRDRAVPILRASASLAAIRDHIVAGHSHGAWWNLPVVLASLGQSDEALEKAREYLRTAEGHLAPGPAPDQYREFVARLEAWLLTKASVSP